MNNKATRWETMGSFRQDGDFVYFGMYPQTRMAEGVQPVGQVRVNDCDYYVGSDDALYVKLVATPAYHFTDYIDGPSSMPPSFVSTNVEIIKGNEYYFKVEPIKWRLLNPSQDREKEGPLLITARILDGRNLKDTEGYTIKELQEWVCAQFFHAAFTPTQRDWILQNSAMPTPLCLPDVSLLTRRDLGFGDRQSADAARRCECTDYAICRGVYGSNYWHIRSSQQNTSERLVVFSDGEIGKIRYNHKGMLSFYGSRGRDGTFQFDWYRITDNGLGIVPMLSLGASR